MSDTVHTADRREARKAEGVGTGAMPDGWAIEKTYVVGSGCPPYIRLRDRNGVAQVFSDPSDTVYRFLDALQHAFHTGANP